MNTHPPIVTDKTAAWSQEFDLQLPDFDAWMTRQLNCLVGRFMSFATPLAQSRGRTDEATPVSGPNSRQ